MKKIKIKKGPMKRAVVCLKYWRTITNKGQYALGATAATEGRPRPD